MQRRATIIIRAIAVAMAATALYRLFRNRRLYWFILVVLFQEHSFPDRLLFRGLVPAIIFALALALKLVASCGLFRVRSWARILAIVVLLFDYASGFAAAIQMCRHTVCPLEPPLIDEGMVVCGFVSLWPSYIIAVVGIISVFLLTRNWIAAPFKETSSHAL